jgi:hypothetical protein
MMKPSASFTSGMLVGASAMFILDPKKGHSRRAYFRDQAYHFSKIAMKNARVAACDLGHRTQGLISVTKSRLLHPEVSDEVLIERVRSRLGRVVSSPRSIEISAREGKVLLKGQVLAEELDAILSEVRTVIGVKELDNELNLFDESTEQTDFQGRSRTASQRRVEHFPFGNIRAPGVRFLIGSVAGGALTWVAYQLKKVA